MVHGKHRRKYSRVIGDQFHEFTTLRFWRSKNQIWAIYHRSREKNWTKLTLKNSDLCCRESVGVKMKFQKSNVNRSFGGWFPRCDYFWRGSTGWFHWWRCFNHFFDPSRYHWDIWSREIVQISCFRRYIQTFLERSFVIWETALCVHKHTMTSWKVQHDVIISEKDPLVSNKRPISESQLGALII